MTMTNDQAIAKMVRLERTAQRTERGDLDYPDLPADLVNRPPAAVAHLLGLPSARAAQRQCRRATRRFGCPNFADLLTLELAEAIEAAASGEEGQLIVELTQLAAMAEAQIEAIHRRHQSRS